MQGQVHPQLLPELLRWAHKLGWQGQAALSVVVCCQAKQDGQQDKQKPLHAAVGLLQPAAAAWGAEVFN